jgi:type IX secretion system PorP/SprF family membrane protein
VHFTQLQKQNKEMKKKLAIIASLATLFIAVEGFGQQLPMYGQYIFNSTIINPAQAGSSNCNQMGLLGRHQWVGIDGAPRTYSAYANFRLPGNLGIAGGIYQDNIGRIKDLNIQGDIAYHLNLTSTWRFGVGLRAQISSTKVDLTNFQFVDPTDPWYGKDFGSKLLFNTGVGFLFYDSRTFIGISAPKLLRNKFTDNITVGEFAREFHLFAYGGTTLDLSDLLLVTPSIMLKHAESSPLQVDFNFVFGYNQVIDFGGLIRSDLKTGLDAVGLLLGINLGGPLYFGYKYEYPMNDLNLVTTQVHEVSLRYKWCTGRHRTASPRYFL